MAYTTQKPLAVCRQPTYLKPWLLTTAFLLPIWLESVPCLQMNTLTSAGMCLVCLKKALFQRAVFLSWSNVFHLFIYLSTHLLLLNMESGTSTCQKASQAMSTTDAECTAGLGAIAGAELGVWAVVRPLSIFKRSTGSLQAPENPKSEFQTVFPSLSNADISFSFLVTLRKPCQWTVTLTYDGSDIEPEVTLTWNQK